MKSFCRTAEKVYLPTWRKVLVGWLGWDESRFNAWVHGWRHELADENSLFFHYDEWHHILGLLIPDDLITELAGHVTKQMCDPLGHLMHNELNAAIRGRPLSYPVDEPQFDWNAARARADEVLQRYGHGLPGPEDVTAYEARILSRASQEGP